MANLEVEVLQHKRPTFHGDTIYRDQGRGGAGDLEGRGSATARRSYDGTDIWA